MNGAPAPRDFASASLVALVIQAVLRADPSALPAGTVAPDPMRAATLAASDKRALLGHIYRRRGAGPLLAVGRHLDPAATPLLSVLARAAGPEVLIDKWMRLERYGHATNRTDLRLEGGPTLTCRRYSTSAPPTAAENALIAGLLLGVCRLAGARGPALAIDGKRFDEAELPGVGPLATDGATFSITWNAWEQPVDREALQPDGRPVGDRLVELIATDLARNWSLGAAARLLGRSARSLQRDLAAEDLTFSTAMRRARIEEAVGLLRTSGASLAEIGYCCGYADQPHFQRDFRRALNMSPGTFRRISLA